ncbi:hypothetical protein [Sphingomonas desiccabilis]|uniref:hypothetical protein n=1 Tax=Sphingomonas desiccabilis TaxID=429134 RepID=UPI0013E9E57C|nr:hypothetical protein [Sphingomonas desiccabilis]MBB3909488.1 hypothetical protein [Sphingomonas desiccabilis]
MADRDMGTPDHNLSTEHQKNGDATLPSDTLDKPADEVSPAKDFDPVNDVGKPQPGGR